MKKALLINVLIIVLVASLSIAATFAYFSGNDKTQYAEITMAKVGVNSVGTFPLQFTNMLPGETQTKSFGIYNAGNVKEDFYVQMVYDLSTTDKNFCYVPTFDPSLAILTIKDQWGTVMYNNSICYLYSWSAADGMAIPNLAMGVDPYTTRTFQVSLTLSPKLGNAFQGAYNADYINMIGVQANGPAPKPVEKNIWPDGDSNYQ
jgi:predicted ribosomally synthesized peptide with SipW-like signal peptide